MWYYGETYPIEVCKWNQKVEKITFMIIQLHTKILSAFTEER